MAPTILSARRAARVTALGVLTAALLAGCGSASDEGGDTAPPAEDPGTSQEGDGASESDGGGDGATSEEPADDGTDTAASDGGGASDGDGTAAEGGDEPLPADADLATAELPITAEKAVEIGKQEAGGGDLVQIEIDHDRSAWEWELELVLDGTQHELDIDATTGEVTQHETDDDDDRDPVVDVTAPMTPQEALEIALGEEPGRVSGWELGSDDDRVQYQIEIVRPEGGDVDVEVDVDSGDVRIDD